MDGYARGPDRLGEGPRVLEGDDKVLEPRGIEAFHEPLEGSFCTTRAQASDEMCDPDPNPAMT
jgi:hypothetical protein